MNIEFIPQSSSAKPFGVIVAEYASELVRENRWGDTSNVLKDVSHSITTAGYMHIFAVGILASYPSAIAGLSEAEQNKLSELSQMATGIIQRSMDKQKRSTSRRLYDTIKNKSNGAVSPF